jgi:hypothetical protein
MLTIRAMSDGTGYSARHLEHSDYYAEGERVTGPMAGPAGGTAWPGWASSVGRFEALRQGLDPQSGELLRQRHSADRAAADGSTQNRGRNPYDFTISAPKSVSTMAELGGDARLTKAHRKAVQETLKELEHHAASRVLDKVSPLLVDVGGLQRLPAVLSAVVNQIRGVGTVQAWDSV